MNRYLIPVGVALMVCLISLFSLAEDERHIHINGEHLTESQILQLDKITGYKTSDGYYWINPQTGHWGYEGSDQSQGVIQAFNQSADNSAPNSSNNRSSYNDVSSTGTFTSGKLNGQDCTFVSVGGTTLKSCD